MTSAEGTDSTSPIALVLLPVLLASEYELLCELSAGFPIGAGETKQRMDGEGILMTRIWLTISQSGASLPP